jgi:hypothetical protein
LLILHILFSFLSFTRVTGARGFALGFDILVCFRRRSPAVKAFCSGHKVTPIRQALSPDGIPTGSGKWKFTSRKTPEEDSGSQSGEYSKPFTLSTPGWTLANHTALLTVSCTRVVG